RAKPTDLRLARPPPGLGIRRVRSAGEQSRPISGSRGRRRGWESVASALGASKADRSLARAAAGAGNPSAGEQARKRRTDLPAAGSERPRGARAMAQVKDWLAAYGLEAGADDLQLKGFVRPITAFRLD